MLNYCFNSCRNAVGNQQVTFSQNKFLAIVSKLIKLRAAVLFEDAIWRQACKSYAGQWTVDSLLILLHKMRENPIVFWFPPPLLLSAGLWRSAGFRKRDREMFPVAGLSAAD